MEVCLSRVFSSLDSPESAKLWLVSQGLKGVSLTVREGRVSYSPFLGQDLA